MVHLSCLGAPLVNRLDPPVTFGIVMGLGWQAGWLAGRARRLVLAEHPFPRADWAG